ncbi:hypothetical protein BD779DRAFT_1064594 [Infundibulicybe gibba]|nr:hypothetical protein BD779DRAFT_1064594 [Infundibulicybe gibba]
MLIAPACWRNTHLKSSLSRDICFQHHVGFKPHRPVLSNQTATTLSSISQSHPVTPTPPHSASAPLSADTTAPTPIVTSVVVTVPAASGSPMTIPPQTVNTLIAGPTIIYNALIIKMNRPRPFSSRPTPPPPRLRDSPPVRRMQISRSQQSII